MPLFKKKRSNNFNVYKIIVKYAITQVLFLTHEHNPHHQRRMLVAD